MSGGNGFVVGEIVVCSAKRPPGGLTPGKRYIVESLNGPWVRVQNDLGLVGGYAESSFVRNDEGIKGGAFCVAREIAETGKYVHFGPYYTNRSAETAAKEAYPDGAWIVIEMTSAKEIGREQKTR